MVDVESGTITNLTRREQYRATPVPPFMQEIIAAGGLINYVARRLKG
jgi:3-isopropylmalate dehydrogenase/3-isopropylmalate/(R)-2-methylmalate dehydratase small subunit